MVGGGGGQFIFTSVSVCVCVCVGGGVIFTSVRVGGGGAVHINSLQCGVSGGVCSSY